MESQIRRIQKRYLCEKCKELYSKLSESHEEFTQCPKCDWMGEEITEDIYKNLKKKRKDHQNYNQTTQHQEQNQGNLHQNLYFNSIFNDSLFGQFFTSPFANRINSSRSIIVDNIFMPEFIQFGSSNNATFRDNFSSNFRSNILDSSFFMDILNQMQNQSNDDGVRPTSKKALEKLKVFKLEKSHCKEDKETGKNELPNCIVCMTDIEINSDTLLIPCGHMFHDKCIRLWLEKHNTCPVCRFELPIN